MDENVNVPENQEPEAPSEPEIPAGEEPASSIPGTTPEVPMYIGPKKVKDNISLDYKLPTGQDLFQIDYEDGTSEVLTRVMFEAIVSDKPCDLTELRDKRAFPIVAHLLTVMLNWGLKISEINYIVDKLVSSVNANLDKADEQVWGKNKGEVSLVDVDTNLRKIKPVKVTVDDILKSS